ETPKTGRLRTSPSQAPPLQGRGWGGGHRPCARLMAPAPLRLGSKLPSLRCPSPEGEGLDGSQRPLPTPKPISSGLRNRGSENSGSNPPHPRLPRPPLPLQQGRQRPDARIRPIRRPPRPCITPAGLEPAKL